MATQKSLHPFSIDAVVFDCDGTLTSIEGVDELARMNGVHKTIAQMTAKAMSESGLNPELYASRLDIIQPSEQQVNALSSEYYKNKTPYASEVIKIFLQLRKQVYIVSAGLAPAVKRFGQQLNVPEDNIFAVDINFDTRGNYLNFDHHSVLTFNDGKKHIVGELRSRHASIAYIGDGLNDLITVDIVNYFIGFGGFFQRQIIADHAHFYITEASLLPLLKWFVTSDELSILSNDQADLVRKACQLEP